MRLRNNIAISESGFVFDANSGETYTLNKQGKEIIDLIKSGKGRDEIFRIFLEKYDIDEYTLDQNIEDFLAMLRRYNLIETAETYF